MIAIRVSFVHPSVGFVAAIACSVHAGCTRPAEERAHQDMQVGHATSEALDVDVSDGLAVVRALDAAHVSLWASAPRFELSLRFHGRPPEELWLEVDNCMAGAVLDSGSVPVSESGRDSKRCFFRVGPFAGSEPVRLGLSPPGADAAGPFRFGVMSDIQEALDRVQEIYRVVNAEPGLDFMLSAGDLTEHGSSAQLEQFEAELEGLDIPYYTTLGNHELRESPCLFQDYFGRGSSSFEYHGARLTLLDSASATIDPIVMGWLDDWLERGAARLHVVAMHVPPRDPIGLREVAFASRNEASQLLARLASGAVDLTLYGHIHSYYRFENAGIAAFISGGGGSHPERFDGIGRHFLVVDADPLAGTTSVRVVRVD
jgi:predicted phosphodiesterase